LILGNFPYITRKNNIKKKRAIKKRKKAVVNGGRYGATILPAIKTPP